MYFISTICVFHCRKWEEEKTKVKQGKQPSLRNAVLRTFGPQLALWGIVVFLEVGLPIIINVADKIVLVIIY